MRPLATLFPSEFLEEYAEEPGVDEHARDLRIPFSVGCSCLALTSGEAKHSLVSDVAKRYC